MGDELHKLYLLEFLVHSVQYKWAVQLDKDFLQTLGPTCIQFKGEYLPSLSVTEIDFCPRDWFSNKTVKFKSGKSCLFSIGNTCVNTCEIKSDITVKRLLPKGSSKSHFCIGRTNLNLSNKFVKVLNSKGNSPDSQCTKMCLDVKNSLGEVVGDIKFILRLTCFGTVIVTEFQKNQDNSKAFLFKGDQVLPMQDDSFCARKNSQFASYIGVNHMKLGPEYGMPPIPNNFMFQQMQNFQNQNINPQANPLGMNKVYNGYQQVYNLHGMSYNPNGLEQNRYSQQQCSNQTPMPQNRGGGYYLPNQGAIPLPVNNMQGQGFNLPTPTASPPFNNAPMPHGFPAPR